MTKRIVSLLLCAMLLCSVLPAFAAPLATNVYTCQKEGHVHSASCFTVDQCTGYHNTNGHQLDCFRLLCTEDHVHTESCYDLSNCPLYGKDGYHVHELSCLSADSREELGNPVINNVTVSSKVTSTATQMYEPRGSYIYYPSQTHEMGVHRFYNSAQEKPDYTMGQTFTVVNAKGLKVGDVWKPTYTDKNGQIHDAAAMRYIPQEASSFNYIVCYCCDAHIKLTYGTVPYKQVNLEDSTYFSEETARKLRYLMYNNYPYKTLEEVLARMKAAGLKDCEELDGSELIAATQLAIWQLASSDPIPTVADDENFSPVTPDDFRYWYRNRAGKRSPGFTAHNESFNGTGNSVPALKTDVVYYPQADYRIKTVAYQLLKETATNYMNAPESSIVVTGVEVTDMSLTPDGDRYIVDLMVKLNAPYTGTGIDVHAFSGDATDSVLAKNSSSYKLRLTGYQLGDDILFELDGHQTLASDVYFFEPLTDGETSTRVTSQNLIGWAGGEIPVELRTTLSPRDVTLFKTGDQGEPLTGAKFKLSMVCKKDLLPVGTFTVDEEGTLVLSGLMPGATYRLEELVAPRGFDLLKEPVIFKVSGDGEGNVEIISGDAAAEASTMTVINRPEVPPSTGDGMQLRLTALVLLASAAILVLMRRRALR